MSVAQPLPIGFFFCFCWKLPPLALPRLLVLDAYLFFMVTMVSKSGKTHEKVMVYKEKNTESAYYSSLQ